MKKDKKGNGFETRFKKGQKSQNWNGIKKGQHISISTEFKKGQKSWNKGKKFPNFSGKNHPNWKGGVSKDKEYQKIKQMEWIEENREHIRFYNRQQGFLRRGANGYHTQGEWEVLKAQYNWICPACQRTEPEIKLAEDHIVPISKGGSNNIENIQPLCSMCNSKKYTKIIKYPKYENKNKRKNI